MESLLNRTQIEQAVAENYPEATIEWRSWVNLGFLRRTQSSEAAMAGIRVAILGSLWIIAITIVFALPVGVGAAIYLEEYAQENVLNRIIKTNIDNLAGVPSIIYGMLGLAIFVRGTAIPGWGGMDRSVLAGGLTLGLLVLPLIIINAQEAIRAVPDSLRQAGYGLGRDEVAGDLAPRVAQRAARHPHRQHPGDVARAGRDGPAGGGGRHGLCRRRSRWPLRALHRAARADLPVGLAPAGGVPAHRRRGDCGAAGAAALAQRHGHPSAQPL